MKIHFINRANIIGMLILTTFALQACALSVEPAETKQTVIEQPIAINPSSLAAGDNKSIKTTIEEPIVSSEPTYMGEDHNGLTNNEVTSLIFMREEEKLAHDVYLALYDLWGLPLFQNIARSEETHTESVKHLLDTFNIPDPADTSPLGVFANPDLQTLYDDLVAMGEHSLADALKVGGTIEEIDILDIQEALDETNNADIKRVYENLIRGSENHLRAFTSILERQTGETYQPQYMNEDAYQAILAQASVKGGRNRKARP